MAESKINFSFENLHFSCEGENGWVEKQLNNVLSRLPDLLSAYQPNGKIAGSLTVGVDNLDQFVFDGDLNNFKPLTSVSSGNDFSEELEVSKKKSPRSPAKSNAKRTITSSPLSKFLKEKRAESNQVRKFLAAAVFVSKNGEIERLSTPLISRTLKYSGLDKLKNPSDCLNKNEKKGFCIKEDKEFMITEEGYRSINGI